MAVAADTPSTTKRQRLESAGYVHVAGWVPAAYGAKVEYQIDAHAADVEQIANAPKQRGWPKGKPRKRGE